MKIAINTKNMAQIFFYTIIMFAFIAGVETPAIAVGFGVLGYFLCMISIFTKDCKKAFLYYIVFLTTSIEVSYFATGIRDGVTVYSFVVLPYITIYGLFFLNFIIYFILKYSGGTLYVKNSRSKGMKFIYNVTNYMMIVGLLVWLFMYLIDDNGIYGQSWYHSMSIAEIYRMSILFFTIQNCIMLLCKYKDFYKQLECVMKNLLLATFPTAIFAFLCGFKGYRAGQSNLLMLPLYAFFAFCMFIFPQYAQNKNEKMKWYIMATAMFVIMLFRPTPLGGKWFLSIVIVVALIFYISSLKKVLVLFSFAVLICFIAIGSGVVEHFLEGNTYLLLKYNEVRELLKSFFGLNQSNVFESSSSFRVDEFVNIFFEFMHKPWSAILGKGIVGTTLHNTSTMSWSGAGTYSAVQQAAGVYVRVHETINLMFLKYGFVGLYGLGRVVFYVIKSAKKSPWAVIGLLWLLFYVGVYQTLLYGAVALVLALYEDQDTDGIVIKDKEENNLYEN